LFVCNFEGLCRGDIFKIHCIVVSNSTLLKGTGPSASRINNLSQSARFPPGKALETIPFLGTSFSRISAASWI
jgi:hypothetical protein